MEDAFEEILKKELAVEEDIQKELKEIKRIITSNEEDDVKLASIKAILEDLQKEIVEARAAAVLESRTGLFGPKFTEDFLAKEMEKSKRDHSPLCVAFFDLDYLKEINDQFGHVVGTKAIIEVAKIIKERVRKSDIVSRYGGDEFLVIFRNSDCGKVEKAIARIQKEISELLVDGRARVSVGAGMIEYRGESKETVESLLKKADAELYKSKKSR